MWERSSLRYYFADLQSREYYLRVTRDDMFRGDDAEHFCVLYDEIKHLLRPCRKVSWPRISETFSSGEVRREKQAKRETDIVFDRKTETEARKGEKEKQSERSRIEEREEREIDMAVWHRCV